MRLAVTGTLNSALFDSLLKQCEPCIQGQDHELELDLSSADWAYPSGLVPLASLLRVLSQREVHVTVEKYPDTSICSYYCRSNFFEQIGVESPCADKNKSLGVDRAVKITELQNATISRKTLTDLAGLLRRLPKSIEGIDATDGSRKSFVDACGELASNTRHAYEEHAGEPEIAGRPRGLLQAQFYPRAGRVELCVCDCGRGIKRSMEGEHNEDYASHLEATTAALAFRNRNPIGDGEGVGLSAVHTYVKKNGGVLRIRTGDALRTQHGSKGASATEQLPVWNGTIIALEILVEKNADLSKIQKRLLKAPV